MSVIGTFTVAKDGGWNGSIHTLTINTKVRLLPNDNRENENAPAFRIFAGRSELGAAWQQRTNGDAPRNYLSVKLDDPSLPEAISAALFFEEGAQTANLVWTRRD